MPESGRLVLDFLIRSLKVVRETTVQALVLFYTLYVLKSVEYWAATDTDKSCSNYLTPRMTCNNELLAIIGV